MEERHKIQVFQRELPLCLELVTQLPKPKLLRGASSRFQMQPQITCMDNLSVLSRLQEEQVKGYSDGDEEKWGAFQPFQRKKKALERQMDRWLKNLLRLRLLVPPRTP
ncbi:hypothetical protein ACFX13_001903 [Malus domestica]